MRFFWFGVYLLSVSLVCDVLSDFSESMLPSKEIRKRVHRTMRVNMRVGKRFGDSDYEEEAPKRRFRKIMRTGKRSPLDTQTQPNTEDILKYLADFKRSAPQFLVHPRIGKNDKTWKTRPLETLEKRSDPKATDLWFGPRIGRSNDEQLEEIPWNYIVMNANRLSSLPVFKDDPEEQQPNEETTD